MMIMMMIKLYDYMMNTKMKKNDDYVPTCFFNF